MKLRTIKEGFSSIPIYAFLIGYSILTMVPFAWAILTSLKTQREIASGVGVMPVAPTLAAYIQILQSDFSNWVVNSFIVALCVTLLQVILNTMSGYALARFRFAGRGVIFQTMLILIMVPAQVTMIPAYIIVAKIGLIDTHLSLILTSGVSIGSIFMMRQFFINFPVEVEEAAKLDGCSALATFFHVVLPMAGPALATQAIFTFMGTWNEFMKPLLYISDVDKYMLTQGLNAIARQYEKGSSWNLIMAGSVISIIPILFMYITLNKYFITVNDQSSGLK
jgi:multiple sugar transport system permease protein